MPKGKGRAKAPTPGKVPRKMAERILQGVPSSAREAIVRGPTRPTPGLVPISPGRTPPPIPTRPTPGPIPISPGRTPPPAPVRGEVSEATKKRIQEQINQKMEEIRKLREKIR